MKTSNTTVDTGIANNASEAAMLKVVVTGHVDHGKSTLLGRLLLDLASVPTDKIEKVKRICSEKAIQFEPAFLLDALKEEQEQGISIDSARFTLNIGDSRILLIDAPGHIEFLKNMTSGASAADIGLLIVDGIEGIQHQTKRHCQVLSLLGLSEIIVVVNKMDRLNFDQNSFDKLCAEMSDMCGQYQMRCRSFIPVSALTGDNVVSPSARMPWYRGQSLSNELLQISQARASSSKSESEAFRMVLQDVYRFTDERCFAGLVLSGKLEAGAPVYFSPSGKVSTIKEIIKFPENNLARAVAGDSIALTLVDQIFVERGEVISFPYEVPDSATNLNARIVWLSSESFSPEERYLLKIGTAETQCKLTLLDQNSHEYLPANGEFLDVLVECDQPIAYENKGALSRFVLCSTYATVAAGVASGAARKTPTAKPENLHVVQYQGNRVKRADRERKAGARGCVLWLTGISGAGKTTLAAELESKFFEEGRHAVMLDGDSIRYGLSSDLDFSKEGRAENIRRIAHAAKLFLDTGAVVIVACISPFTVDRSIARDIIGAEDYFEVFLFCPIEECQRRDAKGLYKLAQTGKIEGFTGVAAPYQAPTSPALRIDTSCTSVAEEVDLIKQLLAEKIDAQA